MDSIYSTFFDISQVLSKAVTLTSDFFVSSTGNLLNIASIAKNNSGAIVLQTGESQIGTSGLVAIRTGNANGSYNSGPIAIATGNTDTGYGGNIQLACGYTIYIKSSTSILNNSNTKILCIC